MQLYPGDPEIMTEGALSSTLGCYILVERYAGTAKIKKVLFSRDPPSSYSPLAAQIVDCLEGRGLPQADLDYSGLTEFQRDVLEAVQTIPRGETRTYGEVAAYMGKPGRARAVGRALSANPFPIIVPCHRVLSKKGLGGFAWGRELKERLLAIERGSL
jgi:methylated-DNA-[protein]-cysteine S-methyltransferase